VDGNIIEKEEIRLEERQLKMIAGGWSADAIEKADVSAIVYESDGLKVRGYAATPKYEGRHPVVIWNRGGAGGRGAVDEFTARGAFGLMASWGYVVLASMYRGSIKGEGRDEFGGADVNDVLNLIPLAESLPQADAERMGMEGWSRGGLQTFRALVRSDRFRCAVVSGGVADLEDRVASVDTLRSYIADYVDPNDVEALRERSPLRFVDRFPEDVAYLVVHGAADEIVASRKSLELATKMLERGLSLRYVLYDDGDHFLKKHRKEFDALRKRWFDKHLKNV
jgi:dipeptidyl aminopeptidase/acylaminoacyl peptidase